MGLESCIDRELQRAKSGLVRGEDYWFYDGLRTETKEVAEQIIEILEQCGNFGPARIIDWCEHDHEISKTGMDGFIIEFGIYESYFDMAGSARHGYKDYADYVKAFKAGK